MSERACARSASCGEMEWLAGSHSAAALLQAGSHTPVPAGRCEWAGVGARISGSALALAPNVIGNSSGITLSRRWRPRHHAPSPYQNASPRLENDHRLLKLTSSTLHPPELQIITRSDTLSTPHERTSLTQQARTPSSPPAREKHAASTQGTCAPPPPPPSHRLSRA